MKKDKENIVFEEIEPKLNNGFFINTNTKLCDTGIHRLPQHTHSTNFGYCLNQDESTWKEQELQKTLDLKDKSISKLYSENKRLMDASTIKDAAIEELINYIARLRENLNENND